MGMYTEIYINVDLIDETPHHVLEVLQDMYNCIPLSGYPSRWDYMFRNTAYLPNTWVCQYKDEKLFGKSFLGKGGIKNYNSEIERFFIFIGEYAEDEFIGYMRYEEDEKPTIIYKSTLPFLRKLIAEEEELL